MLLEISRKLLLNTTFNSVMFRSAEAQKCIRCSSYMQWLFYSTHIYKPKVVATKTRNKSKPRKVNLSSKLRSEFAKYKGQKPVISAKLKEFDFYEGMKYSKFETVPLLTERWHKRGSKGDFFTLYENYIPPDQYHFGNVRPKTSYHSSLILPQGARDDENCNQFLLLGLNEHFIEPLKQMRIFKPADIQVAAIPSILQGKNCVVSAHTGCGKTLAYLLPLIQMILKDNEREGNVNIPHNSPKALILTPSRELASQIYDVMLNLLKGLPLTSKLLVGWSSGQKYSTDLPEVVDILVGSLGTTMKLFRKGEFSTQRMKHLVLDEADQLVDIQNRPQIIEILKRVQVRNVPDEGDELDEEEDNNLPGAQVILASATIPTNLVAVFEGLIDVDSLERITSPFVHNVLKSAPQLFLRVGKALKGKTLIDLVEKDHKRKRSVLIFSNKSETAEWVSYQLKDCGFDCKYLSSHVPSEIRRHLFKDFQQGVFNILSTTTMAARGLDTVRVQHVINFEFPLYISEYIHQIGRVGRIGSSKECHITNIITHPREVELVQKIELAVRLNQKLQAVNANIPGIIQHRHEKDDVEDF